MHANVGVVEFHVERSQGVIFRLCSNSNNRIMICPKDHSRLKITEKGYRWVFLLDNDRS